ncbi:N-acetylmuramoyl-L-alanine amidase [Sphingobacterium paucimobilis]|nr:N-acetylmuramoyl-L-alanine amidase [Sphingobacterium paucimobilis]
MLSKGFVVGVSLFMLIGCSTSKKVTVAKKVDVPVGLSAKEVLTEVEEIAKVEVQNAVDTTVFQAFRELTPEEKIVEQKRMGIYKGADWAAALHYDLRKPNFVIIHHTAQNSVAQTVRTFQVPHSKVSAHYVIGRDGQVIQMLNDYERAWHAGKSKWGNIDDLNSVSLGIELDNNGKEPFPDAQINSLLILLDTLKAKYLIPQLNFIGHADIAPMRKDDPSVLFPWKRLAERGFGIWYNEDYLMMPPANFNPIDALKIMGYDMRNQEGAIRAFKRKYIVKEVNGVLTAQDQAVLYDLYRKYY